MSMMSTRWWWVCLILLLLTTTVGGLHDGYTAHNFGASRVLWHLQSKGNIWAFSRFQCMLTARQVYLLERYCICLQEIGNSIEPPLRNYSSEWECRASAFVRLSIKSMCTNTPLMGNPLVGQLLKEVNFGRLSCGTCTVAVLLYIGSYINLYCFCCYWNLTDKLIVFGEKKSRWGRDIGGANIGGNSLSRWFSVVLY